MECLQDAIELDSEVKSRKRDRTQDSPDLMFSEAEVRHIMHQLFSGCSHFHKMGITHRDIKPQNILMTSDY